MTSSLRLGAALLATALIAGACGVCGKKRAAAVAAPVVVDAGVVEVVDVDPVVAAVNAARRDANAALGRDDVDGALAVLDQVVRDLDGALVGAHDALGKDLLCDRAAVLSRRAKDAAPKQRERDLRAAVVDCPREPLLKTSLANALVLSARDLGSAAETRGARRAILEESLALAPTAAAGVDLARVCDEDNDLACALAAAEVAVAQAPEAPGVVELRDRLRRQGAVEGDFKSARQSHFVARFEGYGEERTAWGALATLEQAYFTVGQALDLYPRDPVTVIIYTGSQYAQATSTPDWSSGVFDGKIRIREGQLAAEQGTLADTLHHEYVHAALRNCVPGDVPIWFHEGLAQHFEKGRPAGADLIRRVGKAPLPALERSFLGLGNAEAQAAYATSLALVQKLVAQRGAYGLSQLLAELKRGASFSAALQTVYATSLEKLYANLDD